jgi:hypothetical protein
MPSAQMMRASQASAVGTLVDEGDERRRNL